MTTRLLIVEDDARILSFLKRGLEAEGYAIACARDGSKALSIASGGDFALIVLDRMLPGMDGLEPCRRMREQGVRSLILMLTAKDQLHDKVAGLKSGADDYLAKPFAFDELLARIGALLRRREPAEQSPILQVSDLRLDPAAKAVWRGDRRIPLTAKEFALLAYLMANAGRVVSRAKLLSNVWNLNFDPGSKVVDVYIRYLRNKLDRAEAKPLIRTVRGFGYTIPIEDRADRNCAEP